MPEVVEELITRLIIDSAEAIKKAQEFRATVEATKAQLKTMAEQTNLSFKDLGKGMIESIKGMGFEQLKTIFPQLNNDVKQVTAAKQLLTSAVRQATTELNKENKELKDNATITGQATNATRSLGDVIKIAFGVGLGQIAVQALRNIIALFKEATQSAYAFVKATYTLAIGLNAIRRAGTDITLADVYKNLDKLQKKFGVFSKKELVEGSAQLINLIRDFGATREEIFALQDAIATLAVVNGRAMDDVQRTVALALSSGYTEGLQRLGVSINRVNIAMKAGEMGFGKVYMSLTEQQRYLATLALILEKTAKYSNDLAGYQDTLVGSTDKAKVSIIDQKVALGEKLLPLLRLWYEFLGVLITRVSMLVNVLDPLIFALSTLVDVSVKLNEKENVTFAERFKVGADAAAKSVNYLINQISILRTGKSAPSLVEKFGGEKELAKYFGKPIVEEAPVLSGTAKKAQAEADRLMDVLTSLSKDMLELQDDTQRDLKNAEDKYWADINKINLDGWLKKLDIFAQYDEKIRDIDLGAYRDTQQAQQKYDLDVLQTNRQFNIRRAESEAKYREQQIKAETDYQERLKKLREGFLMDLEEALHERDARQILRLIKQHNLQKTQASREYATNLEEMKRAHALELTELETQRAERLRILQEELAMRLATIQQEAQWRRDEAARERDEKLVELSLEIEQEKAARKVKWDQEILDIQQNNADRLTEILKGLAEEYNLTEKDLDKIKYLWESMYGESGVMAQSVVNAKAYMKQLATIHAEIQKLLTPLYNVTEPSSPTRRRAKGGIDYVNTATSLTFGEAGPEMVLTMPLTRPFSGNQYLNGNLISGLSGNKGSIDIELLLSPDLVARVVRQSGDHVANVLMEVQRNR